MVVIAQLRVRSWCGASAAFMGELECGSIFFVPFLFDILVNFFIFRFTKRSDFCKLSSS